MNVIIDNLGLFASGLLRTIEICIYSGVGSLVLGVLVAVMRVAPAPILQRAAMLWVTVLRNCPLTVVLFFFAFGIPELGINGSYFSFSVMAMIVYTSAFVCEAVRSGINAVPAGQSEAARAIGLSFGPTLRLIVLPQALRMSLPPVANVMVFMIKNSAIVGAFGVGGELFSVGDTLISERSLSALPVLSGIVICYLLLILPATFMLGVVERRAKIHR